MRYGVATVCLLLCAAVLPTALAQAADGKATAELTIDDTRLPQLSVVADKVRAADLLKTLGARLGIAIDNLSAIDPSKTVSGTFKGDVADVLGRVLFPDGGFVALHRGTRIERIILTGNSGAVTADRSSSPAEPPRILPTARAEPPPPVAAAQKAPAAARPVAAASPPNPIRAMLGTQLALLPEARAALSADALGGGPAPQTAAVSAGQPSAAEMAALTRAAQQNVTALGKALQAVCIGPNCAR